MKFRILNAEEMKAAEKGHVAAPGGLPNAENVHLAAPGGRPNAEKGHFAAPGGLPNTEIRRFLPFFGRRSKNRSTNGFWRILEVSTDLEGFWRI